MSYISKLNIDSVEYDIKDDSAFRYVGTLTANDNLNELVHDGVYVYSNNSCPQFAPFTTIPAIVEVIGKPDATATQKIQIAYAYSGRQSGDIGYRRLFGGSWSDWRYFSTTDHTHKVGDVSGVAKEKHKHAISDLSGVAETKHSHTISDLSGVAPDGYGLGTRSVELTSSDNLNNMTKNGWYAWSANSVPSRALQYNCMMHVMSSRLDGKLHVVQNVITSDGNECRRIYDGESWGNFEWINPPMKVGVEYQTAERYNGKVVYRKLVNYKNSETIGVNDDITQVEIPHGITEFSGLVRLDSKFNYANPLPFRSAKSSGSGISLVVEVNTNNIIMRLGSAFTSRDWFFDLSYTK